MTTKTHGYRCKTRRKLKKRGLTHVTDFMKEFNVGDKVLIKIDSSVQTGHPHPRFNNRTGLVKGMQGNSYLVEIMDINKKKTMIVSPIHLKPQ
ncbi:MAG: 50S ribosomal protein L21e [Candidatus Diapherotrites archaeon]|nr:50S ribosomal protein L21e [Candidatus Diapherotrites archaeon]